MNLWKAIGLGFLFLLIYIHRIKYQESKFFHLDHDRSFNCYFPYIFFISFNKRLLQILLVQKSSKMLNLLYNLLTRAEQSIYKGKRIIIATLNPPNTQGKSD